jgi:hypothetical protein
MQMHENKFKKKNNLVHPEQIGDFIEDPGFF